MNKKKPKYNYNYAFVFYDVSEKRVAKVFKVCKKYFHHFQNSVFRGGTSPSKLISFKSELKKIIVTEEDFICIIQMTGKFFEEEILGTKKSFQEMENGTMFI